MKIAICLTLEFTYRALIDTHAYTFSCKQSLYKDKSIFFHEYELWKNKLFWEIVSGSLFEGIQVDLLFDPEVFLHWPFTI